MPRPAGFTWIDKPLVAALARPHDLEELAWLRQEGVEVLVSLTEDPPRNDWIESAGLLLFHVPMIDMEAPSLEQIERCLSAIRRANERGMGVAIHCGAGLGRTGVVIACYFVEKGLSPDNAIARVRRLRPGSIETPEQEEIISEFSRRPASGEGRRTSSDR